MRNEPLLAWQFTNYPTAHMTRRNLIIHIFSVPIFILSAINVPLAIWNRSIMVAIASAVTMVVAFALQGMGHRQEPSAPIPFEGPGDAIKRILAEQFITFPRFVITGGFANAWRAAKQPAHQ